MAEDALKQIVNRNEFYRDNFRRVTYIMLLSVLINVVLGFLSLYSFTHRPDPKYFATSSDGRITPLYSLDQPMVSVPTLLEWAKESINSVYTYNFVNYRKELQKASERFTPDGWKNFQATLKDSNNLKTVVDSRMVVNSVATGAPVMLDRGIINGRYAWKVQTPVLVTYRNQARTFQQPLLVTMVVIRVPTVNDPKGIRITQFLASRS